MKVDHEFKASQEFLEGKLGGKSMLFTNGIGMFLVRNRNDNYECISEAITNIDSCLECLPKDSKIKLVGLQIVIETKKDIDNNMIERLENFGYQFQSSFETINDKDEPIWYSKFFMQVPDWWEKDFEEFLKTYPDYLQKKYKEKNNEE